MPDLEAFQEREEMRQRAQRVRDRPLPGYDGGHHGGHGGGEPQVYYGQEIPMGHGGGYYGGGQMGMDPYSQQMMYEQQMAQAMMAEQQMMQQAMAQEQMMQAAMQEQLMMQQIFGGSSMGNFGYGGGHGYGPFGPF